MTDDTKNHGHSHHDGNATKNHHQGEDIYCNPILELSNCPTDDGCLLTLDAVDLVTRAVSALSLPISQIIPKRISRRTTGVV